MTAVSASNMARALGKRGGRARAARLPAAEKKRIASMGGRARLESLRAARRIADNFRYAAAARELRAVRPVVRRLASCRGPVAGIYERAG